MRLDAYLAEKGYFATRSKAEAAIKRGEVFLNGAVSKKPSKEVSDGCSIEIVREKSFVSEGGHKLEKALSEFGFEAKDLVFADIGASTGGFTDVLLKRGAKTVFAVDVGKDLLDESLKSDPRVVVMDGVNARYIKKEDFPVSLDGVVADCSFISLKLILPSLVGLVEAGRPIFALVKPQFECGGENLSKSGILLRESEQKKVVSSIYSFCRERNLAIKRFTCAPLKKKKNIEYIAEIVAFDKGLAEEDVLSVVTRSYGEWRNL